MCRFCLQRISPQYKACVKFEPSHNKTGLCSGHSADCCKSNKREATNQLLLCSPLHPFLKMSSLFEKGPAQVSRLTVKSNPQQLCNCTNEVEIQVRCPALRKNLEKSAK